jgi:hypothetical protein
MTSSTPGVPRRVSFGERVLTRGTRTVPGTARATWRATTSIDLSPTVRALEQRARAVSLSGGALRAIAARPEARPSAAWFDEESPFGPGER